MNPVYVDDAPLASEAIELVPRLIASGNHAEAIRVLQRLLDESGERLIADPLDPDLYTSVRSRVLDMLSSDPDLLGRYRQSEGPSARALLIERGFEYVERTRLLTPAGYVAALRVAQHHLERGDFEGARLVVLQLEHHPDRIAAARAGEDDAGRLLGVIARYLDRESVWQEAQAWSENGRLTRERIEPPAGVGESRHTPMDPAGEVGLNEMVQSPLHSTDLPGVQGGLSEGSIDFRSFTPWAMAMVAGDDLIVNDGGAITAWDRFTFQRRWSTRPPGGDVPSRIPGYRPGRRGRSQLEMQDISAVDVRGDLVAAITGWVVTYGRGGVATRYGDPRLHVLDRATGKIRWSFWPIEYDIEMAQAILVGRPVFAGGLVIVRARKQVAARRSLGTYLFALDERTGEVIWSRLVGSSGSLPYQSQAGLVSPDLLVREGIVYISSEIGVIAAIEAWSGDFAWARVRGAATFGGFDPAPAHAVCQPVIHGDDMFVLSADRSDVLRLGAHDGSLRSERSGDRLGKPRYLLGAGGVLAGVGDNQITLTAMEGFEDSPVRLVLFTGDHRLSGRVVVAGDRLLAPVEGGLEEIVVSDPDRRRLIELRESGLVTALSGQIVVTDSSSVHGYLVWATAERVLRERMDADPDDPTPAMTFAQLSVQASRPERLIETVDRALGAIRRMGAGDLRETYRERLFAMLLEMVRDGTFEATMQDDLLERLGATAATPTQRVAQLIELGQKRDGQGRASDSVDAYQSILLDDVLAGATWPGPRLSVRADLEAARRLRDVLDRHGHGFYGRYESLAQSELRAMGDGADPVVLERFARRYPSSSATTQAWLAAADRYESSGRGHQAVRALRMGLRAGEGSAHAELSGRLIEGLLTQQRWAELDRVLRSMPGDIEPTMRGRAIELGEIRARVGGELAARAKRARAGVAIAEGLVFVESWELARPAMPSEWASVGYAGIEQRDKDGVRLGAMSSDASVLWERGFGPGSLILRADPRAMLVLEIEAGQRHVLRIDAKSGQTIWQSEAIAVAGEAGEFKTPMDGPVRGSELVVVADAHTLVICSRSGRAMGLDLDDGRALWSSRLPIRRVHDLAIGEGVVAVGGSVESDGPSWGLGAVGTPMIAALDARTGEAMYTALGGEGGIESEVRWIRVAQGGRIVAGVGDGVLSADPLAGELAWINDEPTVRASLDAWIMGDRVLVLGGDRDVWSVAIESGRVEPAPLPTRSTTYASSPIEIEPLGEGLVVASSRGVVVLDAQDAVVGADAIPAQDTLLPAAIGSQSLFTIDTSASAGGREYPLFSLDFTGKMRSKPIGVVLNQAIGPERIEILDGVVLISTGGGIVLVPAPEQ